MDEFARTRMLLGDKALERLNDSTIAVFGVGGVGGYVVEALARSGVGRFVLIDADIVSLSNINRQIIATHKSLGRSKVDVMRERINDINPRAIVETRECFYLPENADEFDFMQYSYIVDAVDTVTAKLEIIVRAKAAGVPVISSMGAGNKLDATAFRVADIYETSICPLARVMRRECKKRGIESLKVVYSTEKARENLTDIEPEAVTARTDTASSHGDEPVNTGRIKRAPGSIAYVPSVAGLIIAGEVIKDICNIN